MQHAPMRIASVHIMRTGGTFANTYLSSVMRDGWNVRISWFEGLQRDWTDEEIRGFAGVEGRVYVHNHVKNWPRSLVEEYQKAGFFVFSFVRPIGDQLCSLYHWLSARDGNPSATLLDEFISRQISRDTCMGIDYTHWEIPQYWPILDYVAPFSIEAFSQFVEDTLGLPWQPNPRATVRANCSDSRGYAHYCQTGQISESTQRAILESRFHQRFESVCNSPKIR